MIKVEVKYKGKPIRVDKETGKMIEHVSAYTIRNDDYEYEGSWARAMRKEITKINKRYQGVYSIRFYV